MRFKGRSSEGALTEDVEFWVSPSQGEVRQLGSFAGIPLVSQRALARVQLDLDLSSRRVDLIAERYDLAIRMGDLSDDATLVARKVDEQHFALYASPIYLALHPAPVHPDELAHHASVRLLSDRGSAVPWKLLNDKEVWEAVPPGRLTLNSVDMIQQLLLDGAGIGALPCSFVVSDLRLGRLVRVLPEWALPAVAAWAVMPMRRYLPAKTRAFLDHLERFMEKG